MQSTCILQYETCTTWNNTILYFNLEILLKNICQVATDEKPPMLTALFNYAIPLFHKTAQVNENLALLQYLYCNSHEKKIA